MAESLKVPADKFDAALAALLKAPPMPLAGISPKKAKGKRPAKKRA
jgi:hypothetical protein